MILGSLLLGLAGVALSALCIRRAFAALDIDLLEMLVFFGIAERVTTPHPLVVVRSRGREEHLGRARYRGYEPLARRAA